MSGATNEIVRLADSFRRFARSLEGTSELYRAICEGIAENQDVLRLLEQTPISQRHPMLLLAAVHELLLAGTSAELRACYPSLGGTLPADLRVASAAFNDFCLHHAYKLQDRLVHGATQTNEVGRVAATRPLLAELQEEGIREIALVEFGASAGLNLLPEQCRVRYSNGSSAGLASAPIDVACELRGAAPPGAFLERALPAIRYRRGLDQAPVDPNDDVATRWLLACVWPDQVPRFARTQKAIEVARRALPEVARGRLPEDAFAFLAEVPRTFHLCILTTWVLAYLRENERTQLEAEVARVAASRDVTWLLAESPTYLGASGQEAAQHHHVNEDTTLLLCRRYRGGARSDVARAQMHGHATWIRWF